MAVAEIPGVIVNMREVVCRGGGVHRLAEVPRTVGRVLEVESLRRRARGEDVCRQPRR
jgi:hypothetical protein